MLAAMDVLQEPVQQIFAANRARGRIALVVRAVDGATRRAQVREEGSLRVRCPGAVSRELEAVIVNTGGGVAAGDELTIEVSAEPGAHLTLTTTAAEKIYRSLGAPAVINLRLNVGAGGFLGWLPLETILFDRARLDRTIDVEFADDARLVLAEALVFGRAGMGEVVGSGWVRDRWRIRRDGRLLHAEAMRLEGEIATRLAQRAVANGAVAIATVLVVPADEATAAGVRALAPRLRGEAAASAWKGMMTVRLCAKDGAALRHDLVEILSALGGVRLPRLWLN
jgi:urease accessory protein